MKHLHGVIGITTYYPKKTPFTAIHWFAFACDVSHASRAGEKGHHGEAPMDLVEAAEQGIGNAAFQLCKRA